MQGEAGRGKVMQGSAAQCEARWRQGQSEARGLGLLAAPAGPARVAAIVDLDHTEDERLPPLRAERLAGADLPVLHKVEGPHFPAALMLYLQGSRAET